MKTKEAKKVKREPKKKMPTSKVLAYVVLWVWVLVTAYSCTVLLLGFDSSSIFMTVSGSLGIVLSGFYTKSFLENKQQYEHHASNSETINQNNNNNNNDDLI